YNPRLILLGGNAVHLGATFAIADQHVVSERGLLRRLPVFPADERKNFSRTAQASFSMDESIHRLNLCFLKELETDRFSGPFSFRVSTKPLNKLNRAVRFL